MSDEKIKAGIYYSCSHQELGENDCQICKDKDTTEREQKNSLEQEAKVKRARYEELAEKDEKRRLELSEAEIEALDREMGQIEFWMRDKMNEEWVMGSWTSRGGSEVGLGENITYLPCQGGCMVGLVEIRTNSNVNDKRTKCIFKGDCYRQDNTHYTCADCYEKKLSSSSEISSDSSNQIKSNQIKSNQIKSNQIKSNSMSDSSLDTKPKTNHLPWILGGIGLIILVGILVYFLTRKGKEIKK